MPVHELPGSENDSYRGLTDAQHGLDIEVQAVDHPSRVHLDIETDDIDAEVLRLEGLGAKKVEQVKGWWVMEAPTGQRFCVVRAKRRRFRAAGERVGNERDARASGTAPRVIVADVSQT